MNNSIQSQDELSLPSREPFAEADPITLVCIARLTADREADDLLNAMCELRNRGIPSRLILAGDGSDATRLRAACKQLNLSVEFLGSVYDSVEIAKIYARARICVVPGRAGLAVIQAMGHGLPVIAHDDHSAQMPEADAIVPGRTGARYTRGSPSSLADAIEWVSTSLSSGAIDSGEIVAAVRQSYSAESQAAAIVGAAYTVSGLKPPTSKVRPEPT